MDEQAELAKFRAILISGIAVLASGCYSWAEVQYLVWGRAVEATVESAAIEQETRRFGRRVDKLVVRYRFDDEGAERRESASVAPDTELPEDGTVTVQYVPGRPEWSRLAGHWRMTAVLVFAASVLAFAFFLWRMHREANEPATWHGRRRR